MEKTANIILEMSGICKCFSAIQALNNVHFDLIKGEVHALVGENGAGKSTFLNIMSGVYKQDSGEIKLNGKICDFKNPLSARRNGIVKVHQELQLIPEMTVAQNIFLSNEPKTKLGTVDFARMKSEADRILQKIEADLSSTVKVKELSTAQMQMVEIAKALLCDFNILALDEPTASLTNREIEQLFKAIRSVMFSLFIKHLQ